MVHDHDSLPWCSASTSDVHVAHRQRTFFNTASPGRRRPDRAPLCKAGAARAGATRCSSYEHCKEFTGHCCPNENYVSLACCGGAHWKFDGAWTSKGDPGGDMFVISNDTIHWAGTSSTNIVAMDGNHFKTELTDPRMHSKAYLSERGELIWANGDRWIKCVDTPGLCEGVIRRDADVAPLWSLDGTWTGKANPCEQTFAIEGDIISCEGVFLERMRDISIGHDGAVRFCLNVQGHSACALHTDGKLAWSNPIFGGAWVRAREGACANGSSIASESATKTTSTTTSTVVAPAPAASVVETTATTTSLPAGPAPAAGGPAPELCSSDEFEADVTYEPLNMDHAPVPQLVDNITECQKRCRNTFRCTHFSFWHPGSETGLPGHCHLQDLYAVRQTHRFGFTSGPPRSWCDLRGSGDGQWVAMVGEGGSAPGSVGKSTYLPEEFRCMALGSRREPTMGLARFFTGNPKRLGQSVLDCQRWCNETHGCAYFSIEFPSRLCTLSPEGARLMFPVFKQVSGPPDCGGFPIHRPNCTCQPAAAGPPPAGLPASGGQPAGRMYSALAEVGAGETPAPAAKSSGLLRHAAALGLVLASASLLAVRQRRRGEQRAIHFVRDGSHRPCGTEAPRYAALGTEDPDAGGMAGDVWL